MSVHSGILKIAGEKSYHPYLSDDLTYDQKFVKVCIEEMLSTINIPLDMCIVIESDNCSSHINLLSIFTTCSPLLIPPRKC